MAKTYSLYTLHVQIRDIEPPIWRRIQVDGDVTLRKLHHILQAAFGWTTSHLHEFEVEGVTYAMGDNDDMAELFAEDPEMRDDRKPRLCRLVYEGARLQYKYDFGDCWEHDIRVEKKLVIATEPYGEARVLGGARACPPEDAGGPGGYEEMLRTLRDKPKSEAAREYLDWAGEDFDPEQFDRRATNATLLRMAWNRWGRK